MGRLTFLCFFLLLTGTVVAQNYSIYQSITTGNGLPSNYVFAVCEDENGFFWAGTDKGLCRYNGFSWQVWDKDNGLPGNYVTHLYADRRGGLWIDIGEKGYFYFDIATGKTRKSDLSNFKIDSYGNLLYETPSQTKGFNQIFMIAAGKKSPAENVGEYKPVPGINVIANANSKKLICLYKAGLGLPKNQVQYRGGWGVVYRGLPAKDNTGSIYLANDTIVITSTHFYKYLNKGELTERYQLFKNNNTYANNCIAKNGCYVTDIKTGYYFIGNDNHKTFYNNKSGLGSDYVNQVYEMKDGTVVFATLGNGLQLKKNDYKKSFLSGNKVVRTIVKSGDKWYILAGEKVSAIDHSTLSFRNVGTVDNSALHLFTTKDEILIGSLKGIEFYKMKGKFQPFHFISLNAGISSILQTKSGFIASTYGNGLVAFDSKTTSVRTLSASMRIIEKTLPLSTGYALLSYEDGLVLSDTIHHKNIQLSQKDGLLSNSIQSIYEDKDTIWIGTKAGLNIYTKGRIVQTISYTKGFRGSKAIYIFHDNQHQLWVVSDKYLHLYNDNRLKAITSHPLLSYEDDLINAATYDTVTGILAIGTLKNISLVSIANIQANSEVTTPKMMDVVVDGKVETSALIEVAYQFKTITFHLAPFATSPSATSLLYYKLEGRDDAWKQLKDSLSFSYAALRPGNYKLKAKITNPDGYESSETLLASLVVSKPFWQQTWFALLLLFATIFITTLVVKQAEVIKRRKRDAGLLMQQTLQSERERISKDLHDHLGSNLVTIVAQVDNIETKLQRQAFSEVSSTVKHLSQQTREVMNVLRETIWAVQENEHSMDSFAIRIRTFLQRLYESTGISWLLKVLPGDEAKLSPKQTLHLFRVIQEASQNIIKHSKASEVSYIFHAEGNRFEIIITDNGIGLNGSADKTISNGLLNMQQRVLELKGSISFETEPGTIIKIEIPVVV